MVSSNVIGNPNENLKLYALAYAGYGYPVFPCMAKGKAPLTPHGFHDATQDPQIISEWWGKYPNANIGIPTQGYCVLDVDAKSNGLATLESIEKQHGLLPLTPTARSGGGGFHYWFTLPKGVSVPSRNKILPGIDIRGDGGLLIVPPSLHASGNRYAWLHNLQTPLALAPDWLLKLINKEGESEAKPTQGQGQGLTLVYRESEANDLATHQGESEGKRNGTLCRLLGVHLDRGDSPATLEALALAWAKRCSPPYPECDVKRTLHNLLTKAESRTQGTPIGNALGVGGVCQDVELQSVDNNNDITEAEVTPTLDPDAYYGLLGSIVKAIVPETEADPAGVLVTLLTCVGNAIGTEPYVSVGVEKHHANLYACLVGDTASGKGQAFSIAKHLLSKAEEEWHTGCLAFGLSSGEGFVERLADAEGEPPKDKRLLCVETEFAKPITVMRREGNTLSAILRSAWDGMPLEVLTRGKSKLKALDSHVSILSHITPEELQTLLRGSVEVANGFSNRFLWCHVERSKLLPFGGNASCLAPFRHRLANAIAKAKGIGEVTFAKEAGHLWKQEYPSLVDGREGAFGKATDRARSQALRLSLLYALLDGSRTIEEPHVKAALAVWRYCEASARLYFAGLAKPILKRTTVQERVLALLSPTEGKGRKELYDALHRNTPSQAIVSALEALEREGRAKRTLDHATGGRPAERWLLATPEPTPTPTPTPEVEAEPCLLLGEAEPQEEVWDADAIHKALARKFGLPVMSDEEWFASSNA